jgi:hypothetical protein
MSTNWREWICQNLKPVPGVPYIYFRWSAQDLTIVFADGEIVTDYLDPSDMDAPGKVKIDVSSDGHAIIHRGRDSAVVPWEDIEIRVKRNNWI